MIKLSYERFLNRGIRPETQDIENVIGDKLSLWQDLHKHIEEKYNFFKEVKFFTKKYGWSIKYTKPGRTMLYLFPEHGAFSALIVIGKKESEVINSIKDQLNENVKSIFDNTEQLHDGRWLWIRILSNSDLNSLKILLSTKAKQKK
ncbi:MAG: DUF3788 family protein [Candidatus Lokiarchaeota archaeon]|nr:DUF3788 family protein [Candidatus Lokiarchaeota archaeon]